MSTGLLTQTPGQWPLPVGASGSPTIRRAGQGLLIVSATLAAIWSAELCRDLWVHQQHRLAIPFVLIGLLVWCIQVGRLWRRWSAVRPPLRLQWTGNTTEQPHWRVIEWAQPVSVRVACDFQNWLLLEVQAMSSDGRTARSLWSWVPGLDNAALQFNSSIETAHRLRALLYGAKREATGEQSLQGRMPEPAVDRQSLASWGRSTLPGSNLVRTVLSRSTVDVRSRRMSRDGHARAWSDTDFQPTQCLPRSEFVSDGAASSTQRTGGRH